jgi:hypothetical protein
VAGLPASALFQADYRLTFSDQLRGTHPRHRGSLPRAATVLAATFTRPSRRIATGVASPGGMGYEFNNLSEFSPAAKEWTWISGNGGYENPDYGVYGTFGTAAAGNIPSARNDATSWTDSSGNFWRFVGLGVYPADQSGGGEKDPNDLWEFNPITKPSGSRPALGILSCVRRLRR